MQKYKKITKLPNIMFVFKNFFVILLHINKIIVFK